MTPDEVVSVLKKAKKIYVFEALGDIKFKDFQQALQSSINQIQDYQKLRERVSVEKIEYAITNFYITNPYVCNEPNEEIKKRIAQAIITYLQQPTEH